MVGRCYSLISGLRIGFELCDNYAEKKISSIVIDFFLQKGTHSATQE